MANDRRMEICCVFAIRPEILVRYMKVGLFFFYFSFLFELCILFGCKKDSRWGEGGGEISLTRHDIVADDLHMTVAIRPRVLVPETDHVAQFVNHYAELVAVLSDTYCLRTVPSFPDERAASAKLFQKRNERKFRANTVRSWTDIIIEGNCLFHYISPPHKRKCLFNTNHTHVYDNTQGKLLLTVKLRNRNYWTLRRVRVFFFQKTSRIFERCVLFKNSVI